MKKHSNVQNTYSQKMYVLMTLLLCLFFILITLFLSSQIFAVDDNKKNNQISEKIFYKNKNPINLDEIIENNTGSVIKEQLIIEKIDMDYTTVYRNNSELPKGTIQVLQEGRARYSKCYYNKKVYK